MLFKAIMDAHFDSKPVIVLDEFQYLGKTNPAFLSVFQRIWEEILKNQSVMVILCGSLISMMESQTLDGKGARNPSDTYPSSNNRTVEWMRLTVS